MRAASARRTLRRLGLLFLLSATTTLGLYPLLLWAAPSNRARVLLFLLLTAYLARKGFAWRHVQRSLKQIRTEAAFVGQRLSDAKLTVCLERADHLWARSLTLHALHEERNRPFPGLLLVNEERRRLRSVFRHALRPLLPSYPGLGLLLLLLLLWASVASGSAAWAWSVEWTRIVVPVAGILEAATLTLQGLLRRRLARFEEALAGWALRRSLRMMLRSLQSLPYAHTVLYRSSPWFAAPQPKSARADD